MNSKKLLLSVLVIFALLISFVQFEIFQLNQQFNGILALPKALSDQTSESIAAIENAQNIAIRSLRNSIKSDLTSTAETIGNQQIQALEHRLQQLIDDISERQAGVRNAEAERDRILKGHPKVVELDQLNDRYNNLLKNTYASNPIENFNTAVGEISFQKRDFILAYVPSSRQLAWLKIGKNKSNENLELIRAWIDEAVGVKSALGYTRQYRQTKPSDYGEYTEALYTKDDMYLKTFIQYERIQGTYGQHSLIYSYYIEIGSKSRSEQYKLEQYNNKLGS